MKKFDCSIAWILIILAIANLALAAWIGFQNQIPFYSLPIAVILTCLSFYINKICRCRIEEIRREEIRRERRVAVQEEIVRRRRMNDATSPHNCVPEGFDEGF